MRLALLSMLLAAVLAAAPACAQLTPTLAPTPAVESYDLLPVDEANAMVEHAAGSGEAWPMQPVMIAVEFLSARSGGHPPFDASSVSLTQERPRGEAPDSAVVTVVVEGLLDDSVRGVWHQLVMEPAEDGPFWQLREARVAYRCWRGSSEAYSRDLCP